jgi:F-box/leucine-rich repeat protein 2/20
MSNTHGIDNEFHLFHFDDYTGSPSLSTTLHSASSLDFSAATMPSHDDLPTSEEPGEQIEEVAGKGKGVTQPMPIRAPMAVVHDLFDMSNSDADLPSTSRNSHQSLFLPPLSSMPSSPLFDDNPHDFYLDTQNLPSASESGLDRWKGKGKEEQLPILPPLSFSPTEFGYGQASSPSLALVLSSPGPSSYGSNYGLSTTFSTTNNEPEVSESVGLPASRTVPTLSHGDVGNRPAIKRIPTRSRSLSNLSIYSTRSLAARSMSRIKLKFSRPNTPSNLTRKLLSRRTTDKSDDCSSPLTTVNQTPGVDAVDAGMNSFPSQWRTHFKVDEIDATIAQVSSPRFPAADPRPPCCHPSPLMHKGRSKSSPFPLSALDYIPVTTTDIFSPIPVVIRNYLDELLPQELRIQILASLVILHEMDHLRAIKEGRWTVAKASSSRNRWVGRDKGIRELVRLSRVSSSFSGFSVPELIMYLFQRCLNHGKCSCSMVSYGLT